MSDDDDGKSDFIRDATARITGKGAISTYQEAHRKQPELKNPFAKDQIEPCRIQLGIESGLATVEFPNGISKVGVTAREALRLADALVTLADHLHKGRS